MSIKNESSATVAEESQVRVGDKVRTVRHFGTPYLSSKTANDAEKPPTEEEIAARIEAAVVAERIACARIAKSKGPSAFAMQIVKEILARGEK